MTTADFVADEFLDAAQAIKLLRDEKGERLDPVSRLSYLSAVANEMVDCLTHVIQIQIMADIHIPFTAA